MERWHRRWTAGAAALSLVVSTAGCGGEGEGPARGQGPAAEVTVGLVTDVAGLDDRGFNVLAAEGLKRAEAELGVSTRILESRSEADYVRNLSTLAEEGDDLAVSVGSVMRDPTRRAAEEFPETSFAIIDFAYEHGDALPNVQGYLFREQESGYLAGYVAGLVTAEDGARTNPADVVSTVGGRATARVDRLIAGFQKGARDANPDVRTLHAYSRDLEDRAKCRKIALDQIARDSDVVFQVAGECGLGALDAAGEEHVWGIGLDKNQASTGPQVLTSALKRVDVAVFEAARSVVDGSFGGGGATTLGLAQDGVGLAKVSRDAPEGLVARVERQAQRLEQGEIDIPEQVR